MSQLIRSRGTVDRPAGRDRPPTSDGFVPSTRTWRSRASPLYGVADGMGGHAGGDVAARTAVDALRAAFRSSRPSTASSPPCRRRTKPYGSGAVPSGTCVAWGPL